MKLEGIVTEIYEGEVAQGKSKGQPFWTITLDTGEKLSAFGKTGQGYIEGVEEGQKVTFECEKKGQYINITGQVEVDVTYAGEPSTPNSAVPKNTERYYKNRISALSASVAQLGGTASTKEVLQVADEFFTWISE